MLKGKHINLRTVSRSDLKEFLALSSDIEARGDFFPMNLMTESSLSSRFDKDSLWADDNGTMLIVSAETDKILGMIVFFKPTHYYDALELGYILYEQAERGKGIVPEAVRMFVKYLFAWKPYERIQLQLDSRNHSSKRVAEKCGFTYEGTARRAIISNGAPADLEVYSILRSEFNL